MNILIAGCGQVGSALAGLLSREGHDVSIVDRSESAFRLLPEDYTGYITVGLPSDQDVLRKAGIENCDAVAAVSPDDNVNIMVSQLAQKIFGVKTVITRIYDPAREQVFAQFGLDTICPTNITVDSIYSALLAQESQNINFGCNAISFRNIPVPSHLIGVTTADIQVADNEEVFAVLHANNGLDLASRTPVRLTEDDRLIIARITD